MDFATFSGVTYRRHIGGVTFKSSLSLTMMASSSSSSPSSPSRLRFFFPLPPPLPPLSPASSIKRRVSFCSSTDVAAVSALACTPTAFICSTWSSMSESSGDTTSVSLGASTMAGSWYVSDLPPPAGMTTKTSRPLSVALMTPLCAGLNPDGMRKTSSRSESTLASHRGCGADHRSAMASACASARAPARSSRRFTSASSSVAAARLRRSNARISASASSRSSRHLAMATSSPSSSMSSMTLRSTTWTTSSFPSSVRSMGDAIEAQPRARLMTSDLIKSHFL